MSSARSTSAASSASSRLCAACGMCCNGVMFHMVWLQPSDSAAELSALGLKLKVKNGRKYLPQPCSAFRGSHCSIYTARPERCRLFECRQLRRVAAGEISEAQALERIREAQRRATEVTNLLARAGGSMDPKRPLSKRCEKAMAEPHDGTSDPEAVDLRDQLTRAIQDLDALLDLEFRVGNVAQ